MNQPVAVMDEAEFQRLLEGGFFEVENTKPHRFLSSTAFDFYSDHSPLPVKDWPFQPLVTTDRVYRAAIQSGYMARL